MGGGLQEEVSAFLRQCKYHLSFAWDDDFLRPKDRVAVYNQRQTRAFSRKTVEKEVSICWIFINPTLWITTPSQAHYHFLNRKIPDPRWGAVHVPRRDARARGDPTARAIASSHRLRADMRARAISIIMDLRANEMLFSQPLPPNPSGSSSRARFCHT